MRHKIYTKEFLDVAIAAEREAIAVMLENESFTKKVKTDSHCIHGNFYCAFCFKCAAARVRARGTEGK